MVYTRFLRLEELRWRSRVAVAMPCVVHIYPTPRSHGGRRAVGFIRLIHVVVMNFSDEEELESWRGEGQRDPETFNQVSPWKPRHSSPGSLENARPHSALDGGCLTIS